MITADTCAGEWGHVARSCSGCRSLLRLRELCTRACEQRLQFLVLLGHEHKVLFADAADAAAGAPASAPASTCAAPAAAAAAAAAALAHRRGARAVGRLYELALRGRQLLRQHRDRLVLAEQRCFGARRIGARARRGLVRCRLREREQPRELVRARAERIALGRRGRELRCQLARVLVHEAQRHDRH